MRILWRLLRDGLWNVGFWILSLICEIPFYFLVCGFFKNLFSSNPLDYFEIAYFVILMTFACRFISLHVLGSWILKRVLLELKAGPLVFGFADFILAVLWVGIWALLQPDGMAGIFFRRAGLFPDPLIFPCLLPIALGSAAFRWVFVGSLQKRFNPSLLKRSQP